MKLADGLDGVPRDSHDALRTLEQSAAAIRALVEVAKQAKDVLDDPSVSNRVALDEALDELQALNDGLEV